MSSEKAQLTLGICCALISELEPAQWLLCQMACLIPETKCSRKCWVYSGYSGFTPSLGRMGEGPIVREVLVIFEILQKSKLGTLGLWENSVSGVTGGICCCLSTALSAVSEGERRWSARLCCVRGLVYTGSILKSKQ